MYIYILYKLYLEIVSTRDHYAEHILRAAWLLTFTEWCHFYIQRSKLRDWPPVTTHMWVRRIDSSRPFMVGNLRCSASPEISKTYSTVYRLNTKGKWVESENFKYDEITR